ncbi:hypothetical protein EHS13_09890 [Paenibacillus psychroresistens]|uniref:Uncharacterized protein n=1 Tax=Paenibacillus psychroresistens TaxID=1778678 RepID=A0A6B8RI12_9BACL|nr:hypothetical protein EHS13_09890 [Paenibacillus psychroresistens]
MKTINIHPSSSNYFLENIDGIKSLVIYTEPDAFGWRYIKITPYNTIVRGINNLKVKTFYIAGGILLLGIITSLIVSRRLYMPFLSISSKLTTLESEKPNNKEILKREMLMNFVQNSKTIRSEALQELFNQFGVTISLQGSYVLLILKIDNYAEFPNALILSNET